MNPIRIGIDARPLAKIRTGLGRYVFELCKELDRQLPNATFYLYSQFPIEKPVVSPRWIYRVETSVIGKKIKPNLWFKFYCGRLCKQDKLDAYWASFTLLPQLPQKTITVSTVYDLSVFEMPETVPYLCLLTYRLYMKRDLKRVNKVISISKGTAAKLKSILDINTDEVIYPALSKIFKIQPIDKTREFLKSIKINFPYILAIGIWEPRKNLEALAKAFLSLKKEGKLPLHKLVFVGRFKGWKENKLTRLVSENQKDIVPLGFVPDDHLPYLYTGADVFVFPSTCEGFGMPVMEAAACGTPVVASDIPELREAGGENAFYIKPTELGIKNGILHVLSNKRETNNLNVQRMTWTEGGRILAYTLLKCLKTE